jgi:hypothetical protein
VSASNEKRSATATDTVRQMRSKRFNHEKM